MNLIHVLLVEDNEGDILLTSNALEDSRLVGKITVERDGESAINFFDNLNDPADFPDLVLLDINLPKRNGYEVLNFIKGEERFKHIPVIMLTTSSSEKDILACYKQYVNCYITKPVGIEEFTSAITKIEDFWMNLASIPV